MSTHKLYLTKKHCPLCGNVILKVKPDYNEWNFWCPFCNKMVVPREELDVRMAEVEAVKKVEGEVVGFVIAIPAPFRKEDAEKYAEKITRHIKAVKTP